MNEIRQHKPCVLLTGATGLFGSAILKELLERGRRVLCVIRASTPAESRARLTTALQLWECQAEPLFERGQLIAVRGDLLEPRLGLSDPAVERLRDIVASVIHAAGSTAFSVRADPDLIRTNVHGARYVFELAAACGCRDWHLVSTAYVCGRCDLANETPLLTQPVLRNEYERTKWISEREALRAAARSRALLTIYRPSVIVGHSETGAISRFAGIHRVFRAVALLARAAEQGNVPRHSIPMRIPAEASACPNLMFVNDAARELAEIFAQPVARGGIYHLTHPAPPSNAAIQKALEEYYDIGGGTFVGKETIPRAQWTAYEKIFSDVVLDTQPYFLEAPSFDRTQTDRFVSRAPTPWSAQRLRQQIHFAESSAWRSRNSTRRAEDDLDFGYEAYFERFVSECHPRFRLAGIETLDLNVRYVIGKSASGDWTCCYHNGRLAHVAPSNGMAAGVTYRIAPSTFWRIVGGRAGAAEAFLSGEVQIEGDVERGLKFAAILHEFVREFPYARPAGGQHVH